MRIFGPKSIILALFITLTSASGWAAQIITLSMFSGPNINPRIERVLAQYNYQIAHKKIGKQKTEIVAVNNSDLVVPSDLIIELCVHTTFIELKEMNTKAMTIPLQFVFHEKITREQLSTVLTEVQNMGIHVSYIRPQRRGFFIVKVAPEKVDTLTTALRKYSFLDQYFYMRDGSRSAYLQDQSRNGITHVTIALKQAGLQDYVREIIPQNIADLSIIRFKPREELKAGKNPTPAGGHIEILMPRRFGLVDELERKLENLEQEKDRIEILKGADYTEANNAGLDSYVIGINDQKYVLKPREDRIMEVAIHVPNIEKKVYDYMAQRKVSQDEALKQFGLVHMRARLFALPIDIFGFRTAVSKGEPSEFIYAKIPDNTLESHILDRILMDFHIYRVGTNGMPNYDQEMKIPNCEAILVGKQKLLTGPKHPDGPTEDGDPGQD